MRHMLLCLTMAVLIFASSALTAEQQPQPVPDAERREGETLTDRLDRSDGIIKPPPVDEPMHVEPPPDTGRTPVIKPDDAPAQQGAPDAAGK